MDLHLPEQTEQLARDLAERQGIAPEDIVRVALEELRDRQDTREQARLWLADFYRRHPPPADRSTLPKSFYDDLYED